MVFAVQFFVGIMCFQFEGFVNDGFGALLPASSFVVSDSGGASVASPSGSVKSTMP